MLLLIPFWWIFVMSHQPVPEFDQLSSNSCPSIQLLRIIATFHIVAKNMSFHTVAKVHNKVCIYMHFSCCNSIILSFLRVWQDINIICFTDYKTEAQGNILTCQSHSYKTYDHKTVLKKINSFRIYIVFTRATWTLKSVEMKSILTSKTHSPSISIK